jgi:predicted dithiol-disulfide oxidoreductase (DUF899 family)
MRALPRTMSAGAPYPKLASYRQRMGWNFRWVSSFETDFNYDFYASFTDEQVSTGTACWNYALPLAPPMSLASAFFPWTGARRGRYSIPAPPSSAGWAWPMARTTTSISSRKVGTRPDTTRHSSGVRRHDEY